MAHTVYKKDYSLLLLAEEVFGDDIVKNAYVSTWIFKSDNDSEVTNRLSEESNYFSSNAEYGLGMDSSNIVIEFKNGRKILFTSSEWTDIKDITFNDDYYEYGV
jgi:hypothetical protein